MITDFLQDDSILNLAASIALFAIGYASKHYSDMWIAGKKEIHAVRTAFDTHKDQIKSLIDDYQKVIDTLDDAVQDPAVNEAQFQQTYGAAKAAWQNTKTSIYNR